MALEGAHYPETVEECWVEIDRLRAYLPRPEHMVRRKPFQPAEWVIVVLASRKPFLRHDEIYNALYSDRLEPPSPENVKVQISKIRTRLRALGIETEFQCDWGRGYQIINQQPLADFVCRKDTEKKQ